MEDNSKRCASRPKFRTFISFCFKQCPENVASPVCSNNNISACDIDLTSLATAPIAFPSLLPNILKKNTRNKRT